jgi:excisionase family DNA binding protein
VPILLEVTGVVLPSVRWDGHSHSNKVSGSTGRCKDAETGWRRTIQPHNEENMNEQKPIQDAPELLRVIEAAQLLALSRTKVYEMAEREEIPVLRIGTTVRIPRRKLLEWIEAQTIGGRL